MDSTTSSCRGDLYDCLKKVDNGVALELLTLMNICLRYVKWSISGDVSLILRAQRGRCKFPSKFTSHNDIFYNVERTVVKFDNDKLANDRYYLVFPIVLYSLFLPWILKPPFDRS